MIQGVIGLPGQGKTILMARWAERDIRRGVPVAANFRLRGADYVRDFAAMIRWAATNVNGTIYLDEAGVQLSSRDWANIPAEMRNMVAQHRHRGLDIIWSAQYIEQVDRSLRWLTQYITEVEKIFAGWPAGGIDYEGKKVGYYLAPIFRSSTYRHRGSGRLSQKPDWVDTWIYRQRWGDMVATGEILGLAYSDYGSIASAYDEWQQGDTRGVSRIR